ncbi:ferredoxin [Leifsonia sp. C5G2]|uniref:ferredoxin n=1 Tax=Leifsonia sp. C5G2 TaxID=2735269 RepID=UPI001585AC9E|nr:ferredoxin [Leifsonia sp. C5G2]NUU05202.1 ferredoxin [Leifsonia sp. C5G2]
MSTSTSTHALHIDWTRCDGRGLCTEILERALTRDDWGYPVATRGLPERRTDAPLREDELEDAEEAVRLCPLAALRLTRVTVPAAAGGARRSGRSA